MAKKKRPGTFGPYNQPWETGQLFEEYMRHYPKLSMTDTSSRAEIDALNIKYRKLEEELAGFAQLRSEIEDLKATLGIIHTREGWNTATTLEEAKARRREKTQS